MSAASRICAKAQPVTDSGGNGHYILDGPAQLNTS